MLLSTGNMPVLPPAPREWTAVPEESVVLNPTLRWPPKGWKSYSPEEKGVVTEYAAGVMEMTNGVHPILRQFLLYKYSHLSLTGAILPPNEEMKMLYHNYKTVRDIALGKSKFSTEVQRQFILCLTPKDPTNMDLFSTIPLRLSST